MMEYFGQGSVEPTVWALAEFIRSNWPQIGIYPNWYLGFETNSFGSIFPFLLAFGHNLTGLSYPSLDLLILVFSVFFLVIGWGLFVFELTKNKVTAILTSFLIFLIPSAGFIFPQAFEIAKNYHFLPALVSFTLSFGGTGRLLSLAILPFFLIFQKRYFDSNFYKDFIACVILFSILILVDFVSLNSAILGSLVLAAVYVYASGNFKPLKHFLFIFGVSILIVGFFYPPAFWLRIFSSNAVGGSSLFGLIGKLFQFAIYLIPFILAILSFKLSRKKNFIMTFCLFWLLTFVFITLISFGLDVDYLTEYSRYFLEIDIGVAILVALLFQNSKLKTQIYNLNLKSLKFLVVILIFTICILSLVGWRIYGFLNLPRSDLNTEKTVAEWLGNNAAEFDRIYLSGSGAFWLNYFSPQLLQVRGGADHVASNPFWQQTSFEIREGDSDLYLNWLKALRVKYLVVHNENSIEYFHDFKNLKKFQNLDKVFDDNKGNLIYQVDYLPQAAISGKTILRPRNELNLQGYISEFVSEKTVSIKRVDEGLKVMGK